MKILIMGLPGSGKTYLSKDLQGLLECAWFNADLVRKMANDWDFSMDGRIRQALRMRSLADFEKKNGRIVICDFVCPTSATRDLFEPDYVIWMDTIESSQYLDTNQIFEKPNAFNYKITEWDKKNPTAIFKEIERYV